MLGKEAFLKLAGCTTEVTLPSGDKVLIRELSAGAFREFVDAGDKSDQYGKLVVSSICDKSGALIYGPDDVPAINALPMSVVRPVWNAALKLNKLIGDDEGDDAKNSPAPSGPSGTNSP